MKENKVELTIEETAALKVVLKLEMTTALNSIVNAEKETPEAGLSPAERLVNVVHNVSIWNKLDRIFSFGLHKALDDKALALKMDTKLEFAVPDSEYDGIQHILKNGQFKGAVELANKDPRTAVPSTVIVAKNLARLEAAFKINDEESKDFTFEQKPSNSPLLN